MDHRRRCNAADVTLATVVSSKTTDGVLEVTAERSQETKGVIEVTRYRLRFGASAFEVLKDRRTERRGK